MCGTIMLCTLAQTDQAAGTQTRKSVNISMDLGGQLPSWASDLELRGRLLKLVESTHSFNEESVSRETFFFVRRVKPRCQDLYICI